MADMTERPAPQNYRTYATVNSRGKSNGFPVTAPNKRGTDAAVKMVSPKAKMNTAVEIK